MSRLVFDIECDELLLKCTKMWILRVKDMDTGEKQKWLDGDEGWKKVLDEADLVAGHNVLGYDLPVLEKLFGYRLPKRVRVHDTLIFSQVLNYRRFAGLDWLEDNHKLATWGAFLGFEKGSFHDWSCYSQEMDDYNDVDVDLSHKVYDYLMAEYKTLWEKSKLIETYMRAEHAATRWGAAAELEGWPFDKEAGGRLFATLTEEVGRAKDALEAKLGLKVVAVDKKLGVVEPKRPKWTKDGFYDAHISKWFGVDPCSGFEGEERLVEGPYSRIEVVPLRLGSVADVKIFLNRHGWKPTEWNYKKVTGTKEYVRDERGNKIKTSPKITEDSLEFLGGDGKLYTDFLTNSSRLAILTTWLANVDDRGNLHGNFMSVGTPSMRARHSIIVNVPKAESPWGKEMRSLFRCKPGWKLVGCDSTGNQVRGLAHYMGNEDFIKNLLGGDVHSFNASVLTKVIKQMGYGDELKKIREDGSVSRESAKRILYAFLFGASGEKLWSYVFGSPDDAGKMLKRGFTKAVPGFEGLMNKLENIYGKTSQTGEGYIPSIAGNRIYVDSFHKLLVYLLQSLEKITCAAALMLTAERLEAAGIEYKPCIFYHDEIDFQTREERAEEAAAIAKQAFHDGPELFGVKIMTGESKVGNNWYEVH